MRSKGWLPPPVSSAFTGCSLATTALLQPTVSATLVDGSEVLYSLTVSAHFGGDTTGGHCWCVDWQGAPMVYNDHQVYAAVDLDAQYGTWTSIWYEVSWIASLQEG